MLVLAAWVAGFGLGSIPFGYLLVRFLGRGDIRELGSGNIGATNVGRLLGAPGWIVTPPSTTGMLTEPGELFTVPSHDT